MAEAYLGRAVVLKKLARLDDALASVDKAIELKSDVAKMHEARAALLRDLGRVEDASAAEAHAAALTANSTPVDADGAEGKN
jgi:predicted RNA polymerase sigma factor